MSDGSRTRDRPAVSERLIWRPSDRNSGGARFARKAIVADGARAALRERTRAKTRLDARQREARKGRTSEGRGRGPSAGAQNSHSGVGVRRFAAIAFRAKEQRCQARKGRPRGEKGRGRCPSRSTANVGAWLPATS